MNTASPFTASTPASLGVIATGNRRHTLDDDEDDTPDVNDTSGEDLESLQLEMLAAWDDYKGAACTALEAGVSIGRAAKKAKKVYGHGNFGDWVDKTLPFGQVWARTCMRAAVAFDLLNGHPENALADDFANADTIEKLAALAGPAQGKLPAKRRLDLSTNRTAEDITDVVAKGEEGTPMDPAQRLRVWEESLETREAALRVSLAALKRREWAVAARERAAGIDPEAAQAQAMADAEGTLGPVDTEAAPPLTPEAALMATAEPAALEPATDVEPKPAKPPKAKRQTAAQKRAAVEEAERRMREELNPDGLKVTPMGLKPESTADDPIAENVAKIKAKDAREAAKRAKLTPGAPAPAADKAPRKPGKPRQSRAKGTAKATPAPKAENASSDEPM